MKKGILLFMVLLIGVSFAHAMEDPVIVQTDPGNEVKVYAWPNGGGPLINVNKGIVDDSGEFVSNFFSLVEPIVRFQVIIVQPNGKKIIDEKYDDYATNEAVIFDCTDDVACFKVDPSAEVVEEETEGESNESIESGSDEVAEVAEEESEEAPITGNAILQNDERSFNFLYPSIGVIVFAIFLLLGIVMSRGKKDKMDPEEKELRELESKVKAKEEQIKKVKEVKDRKRKIEEEKKRLAEEDAQLSNLTGQPTNEQKLEEEKRILAEKEKELNSVQGGNPGNSAPSPASPATGVPPSPPSGQPPTAPGPSPGI